MKFVRSLRNSLALGALLLLGAFPARAEYLFPQFLDPTHPGFTTSYSAWDVLYSPYLYGNYPDIAAPSGTYSLASNAGVTPPPNSSPSNPGAYWNTNNPTITQIGTDTAFIIGPGTDGNIYSFAAPTAYQVADTVAAPLGLVLFQFQTDGSTVDFSSIVLQYTLNGTTVSISPAQYATEYQSASSGFGFSVTNRLALEWNLTGLGVTSFTINFASSGTSMSFQEASLDTASTYSSTVAQARTWTASGNGVWSNGANWQEGTSSVENGNVYFAQTGTSTITLDASHTVGQIGFQTAGNVTINSSGGSVLTSNTGIYTTAAATGTYTINSNYVFGDYNVFNLAGGTVKFNGSISGTGGFFQEGNGTLELNGNNTFTGSVGLEGGTLRMAGTNIYSGGTSVIWGKLIVAGDALNGVAGALGNDSTTISLGADSSLYSSVPSPSAIAIDGDHTIARNIQLAGGGFEKDLGAQNTTNGATFSGAIGLGASTNVHLNTATASDQVNFSGGITGGVAGTSSAPSQVIIDGPGTVTLSGTNNSYLNDTMISSGALHVATGGSLTSNGAITVVSGARLAVDGTLGGNGNLLLHGTLAGNGTVNRTFTVDSTSILNPGEGVGKLTTISETWASGGTFQFNLQNATSTMGVGWNFLQINGSLNITAADVFHLNLASLGLTGQSGLALNFDPNQDATWEIADATGGITGFNTSIFQIDDSAFANSVNGVFSVVQNGNDLFLSYTITPVPEPSTYVLFLAGMGFLVLLHRQGCLKRCS